MHFILHIPVIANTLGKGFDGLIQRADVIPSGGLLDEEVVAFEDVTIARYSDNGLESSPLVCIR